MCNIEHLVFFCIVENIRRIVFTRFDPALLRAVLHSALSLSFFGVSLLCLLLRMRSLAVELNVTHNAGHH